MPMPKPLPPIMWFIIIFIMPPPIMPMPPMEPGPEKAIRPEPRAGIWAPPAPPWAEPDCIICFRPAPALPCIIPPPIWAQAAAVKNTDKSTKYCEDQCLLNLVISSPSMIAAYPWTEPTRRLVIIQSSQ